MRAEFLPRIVERVGLLVDLVFVERAVALVGEFITDVEVEVLPETHGGEEILGLVAAYSGAIGRAGVDREKRDTNGDQPDE